MPNSFFEEVKKESRLLITHSLMGFDLQNYFSQINFKNGAIVICLDSPDADLRILGQFEYYGIKNYQTYISRKAVPFSKTKARLRIATIDFVEAHFRAMRRLLDFEAITRELWPFILAEVTILLVVAYWSDLTLFIPRLLGL